jgi:hypothetical protein
MPTTPPSLRPAARGYGSGKCHLKERSYAPDCARGEIWERIMPADLANAQRAHADYYAELTAKRR